MKKIFYFILLLFVFFIFGCDNFTFFKAFDDLKSDIYTTYYFYASDEKDSKCVSFSYEIGETFSPPEIDSELCKKLGKQGYFASGWNICSAESEKSDDLTKIQYNDLGYVSNFTVSYDSYSFYVADWIASPDTKYSVHHYKQKLSSDKTSVIDDYELFETFIESGTTGEQTDVLEKNYPGFAMKKIKNVEILPDESAIAEIYYDRKKYQLNFISNGGNGDISPMEVVFGGEYKLPKNTFTKDGYKFCGWEINSLKYEDEEKIEISSEQIVNDQILSIDLYAIWISESGGSATNPYETTVKFTFDETITKGDFIHIKSDKQLSNWNVHCYYMGIDEISCKILTEKDISKIYSEGALSDIYIFVEDSWKNGNYTFIVNGIYNEIGYSSEKEFTL